ncbi:phytase [Microbulbifer sp. CNSA002]|uniref:phytase n=1 Tax=Microbulbifer sp. CNSA002 TaxID=3373604 RepID=UPI0039B44823
MRFSIVGVLSCLILLGCDLEKDSQRLSSQKIISLKGLIAEQIQLVSFPEQQYLLLSSKDKGLVLVDESAEIQVQKDGRVEALAIQPREDGSYLVAAYEEQEALLHLYQLFTDLNDDLQLQLLGKLESAKPVSALCFSLQAGRDHLFAIGEDGLGFEYLLSPSDEHWDFTEIRPIYLGEEVNSCSVDNRRGRLLVSQPPVGILALNADAERDEERELLISAKQLGDDFGSLRLGYQQDQIWIAVEQGVQAFDLSGSGMPDQSWTLPAESPASIAVFGDRLAVLNDKQSEITYFPINTKLTSVTDNPLEIIPTIAARGQTDPVHSYGDAADDPAIWVNSHSPANSLIFATDKKKGLNIYHLSGGLKQHFPVGRVNNVDIRKISHPNIDAIAVASNRTNPGLDLFSISTTGEVGYLGYRGIGLHDPYGLCLQQDDSGLYAWVSDKEASLHQLKINVSESSNEFEIEQGIQFDDYGQVEGCVVDDQFGTLFFAEEDRGIWRLNLKSLSEASPELVAEVDGEKLVADIEGLALYQDGDKGYLVISSQGNDSYALFSRSGNEFITHFRVGVNLQLGVDGSSETDGLAVTSSALGAEYPRGLLVVQDGRNRMPSAAQNFKLVDWRDINRLLSH